MGEFILAEDLEGGLRRLTFNRPEKLNAFVWPMYQELLARLAEIRTDPGVRAVMLTGAGRAFCAGHDGSVPGDPAWVPEGAGLPHRTLYTMHGIAPVVTALRTLPQPVIAAVNGPAAGIGYALALACDMILAARSAKFVNAFHNVGTGSEFGLAYLLPRVVGAQRAAELLLTARAVSGEEAERIGLALRCVEDEDLAAAAIGLSAAIAANAPLDIWLTKQSLWVHQSIGSVEAAIEFDLRATAMVRGTEDAGEKRAAFAARRPPEFHAR